MRFGVLALLGAAAAAAADPARARRLARVPVLGVLLALAVLGAASTAWTVGVPGDAWRWGLVTAGFAAVAFAAAVLATGRAWVAGAASLVAVLAVAMGVVGLVAAATADVPLAHRQSGLWRPAATFEYSPALALLVVSALPALLTAMALARHWWQALLAALGGAVAGATLALAQSRTQTALALLVAAAGVALAPRATGVARGPLAAAVALVGAAGLGAYAVAGGYVPVTPPPDGTERLLLIGAVVATAGGAWLAARAGLRRGAPAVAVAGLLLAIGAAGAIAKPTPRLISSGLVEQRAGADRTPAVPPRPNRDTLHPIRDRLLHGRLHIWEAAVETFAERPLHGAGADSYVQASRPHQERRNVFYAHDLPLELAVELGIAGFGLALALYGTAGWALWRGRDGPAAWLLGPAAAAFLAANLVDWPWHLAGAGAVWALALGVIIGTTAAPGATPNRH